MVAAVRNFLIFLILILVVVAAIGAYLVATTPHRSAGIHFPLSARERDLMAQVPASAESFALIPTAAALDSRLRANPITRDALASWTARQHLPRSWMIGSADLVAWKTGDAARYLVHLDPFRAALVRSFLMLSGGIGNTLLLNATGEQPIDTAEGERIAALAAGLPAGDALVVQRQSARGAFPPIGRPAATSVQVGTADVVLTSRAEADAGRASARPEGDGLNAVLRFPRSAILSAAFTSPPHVIGDLNRIFGTKVSSLLADGGAIFLYDVDTRKLLPRPIGVIALPADAQRRVVLDGFTRNAGSVGIRVRTAEQDGALLVSFDDSLDQVLKDGFAPVGEGTSTWVVRIDPARLIPILNRLGDSVGLRIAASHLFRSTRDLHRWIGGLEQAKTIEAADSVESGVETLRVRIVSK